MRQPSRTRDKYGGRVSGDILVPCDGDHNNLVSLADALIYTGLAHPYEGHGTRPAWCRDEDPQPWNPTHVTWESVYRQMCALQSIRFAQIPHDQEVALEPCGM